MALRPSAVKQSDKVVAFATHTALEDRERPRLIDDNGQMRFLDNRWLWPRKAGAAICALSRPTSAVYRFFGGEDRRVQSHLNGLCNQEQPRPGVAGGTLASKLPSLGFSPSRYLRATLGGTRGEN